MGWYWRKEYLDVVLVPTGLLIMFGYHLLLLYRSLRIPHTTTIGHDNHCRSSWVQKIMQMDSKDRGQALTVITSNINAAISLSSIVLVLSSLIGAWIGTSSENVFQSNLIYGNTTTSVLSIKYVALLSCFLVAFACFVQTARCFVHAIYLITMPNADIPVRYVQKAVVHGSNFWSVGIRALYFATTLLMWIFGPIPMFVSSVVTVGVLHHLDSDSSPLHPFLPSPTASATAANQNILRKIGQEMSSMARTIEHRGRPPHGYETDPNTINSIQTVVTELPVAGDEKSL